MIRLLYNAQDVRAYLETQVADISKGEEEPVDDETATFKKMKKECISQL